MDRFVYLLGTSVANTCFAVSLIIMERAVRTRRLLEGHLLEIVG
jgi:hypothetical protein